MAQGVNPGDLVWVGPDTSLYPAPEIGRALNADIQMTDDWALALLVATFDFWCMIMINDSLRYVARRQLMSCDLTPSSAEARNR